MSLRRLREIENTYILSDKIFSFFSVPLFPLGEREEGGGGDYLGGEGVMGAGEGEG